MSDTSKRLPLVELEQTQEYQRLTQKQRLFVATYCEGGLTDGNYDAVAAVKMAYQCKSAEVARIMSYSLMQNIRIIAVLNRHFNADPIEGFLVALDRAIANKHLTQAQLGALRLKCEVMGFATRIPDGTSKHVAGVLAEVQEENKKSRKKKVAEPKPATDTKPHTSAAYSF